MRRNVAGWGFLCCLQMSFSSFKLSLQWERTGLWTTFYTIRMSTIYLYVQRFNFQGRINMVSNHETDAGEKFQLESTCIPRVIMNEKILVKFVCDPNEKIWVIGNSLMGCYHLGFILLGIRANVLLVSRLEALRLMDEIRIDEDRPLWWEDKAVILFRLLRHGRAEFFRPAVMTSTAIITGRKC